MFSRAILKRFPAFLGSLLFCFFLFAPHSSFSEAEPSDTTYKAAPAGGHEAGEFEPAEMIAHHISDDYQFHITGNLYFPLPLILYSNSDGLSVFLSSKFHGPNHTHVPYKGYIYDHGHIKRLDGGKFYNLSITKNVFSMLLVGAVMLWLFTSIAQAYRRREGQAPNKVQTFFEIIIIFIRDEVVKPSIGEKKYRRYLPYMLTLFFFIWFNNLLGLIPIFPGSANVTGNIAVTFTLAALSLLMINLSGNKHYWGHLFSPPGVPAFVKPILIPIELVGVLAKPFALMIRLFANIAAGHIVLLSIMSLIFILGPKVGTAGTLGVGIGVVAFTIFMYLIKLFVAVLQAYIFTFLTSLFIGQAVEEPAHH
ncbi:MAG TPA: F0F1 ATP synthase subunit A [Chitinophagales bacterium]|nr:F0F1 ATP synthase subunit A [Chitinophagales bacterium]